MVKKRSIILGLFALVCNPALATLVKQFNIEELAQSSEKIVYATVQSVKQEGPSGSRKFPSSVITFTVHDTWKGSVTQTVALRQLTNDYKSRLRSILPLPVFKEGEQVVVFLSKQGRLGMASTMGLEQGVFRFPKKEGKVVSEKTPLVNRTANKHLMQEVKSKKIKSYVANKKIDPVKNEKPITMGDLKTMVKLSLENAP